MTKRKTTKTTPAMLPAMTVVDAMASEPAGTIQVSPAPPETPTPHSGHPLEPPPRTPDTPQLLLTLGQGLELVLGAEGPVAIGGESLDPNHVGGAWGQLGQGDRGALAAQH